VCDQVTELCGVAGGPCTSQCTDQATFCAGENGASNAFCVQPKPNEPCTHSANCTSGDYCDQLIHLCVTNSSVPCTPQEGNRVCHNGKAFCSTDGNKCVNPQRPAKACTADADCDTGDECDGLTGVCVASEGTSCTSPCSDSTAYCSDALEHCVKPVAKGISCRGQVDCSDPTVCDPHTKVCVVLQESCIGPVDFFPPPSPPSPPSDPPPPGTPAPTVAPVVAPTAAPVTPITAQSTV